MKSKILVVDDSSLARRTVRQALEALGHTVEEASDGAQALERYFLSRPDLVILDMVMNGMYGLEVLGKIRELNPEARVIIATADIQTSTLDQARAAGASAFLNKPINRQALSQTVAKLLAGEAAWN
ncbi:MAG TPA: response regulator [Opitutaceae bacterium]|jgi:two-component system chemotaxis response regulator CheY